MTIRIGLIETRARIETVARDLLRGQVVMKISVRSKWLS
jgi:hypothetical protein